MVIIEIAKTEKVAGNGINTKAQIPCTWSLTKERKKDLTMAGKRTKQGKTKTHTELMCSYKTRTGVSRFTGTQFI